MGTFLVGLVDSTTSGVAGVAVEMRTLQVGIWFNVLTVNVYLFVMEEE